MTSRTSSALMGTVKYRKGSDFRQVLNKSLSVFFKDALRVAVTNPLQAYAFVRTVRWQKQAARLRSQWEQKVVKKIKSQGIFWSVSLTATRSNFTTVTDEQFVKNLVSLGCRLFFFVEYTPITEDTQDWVLMDEQRASLLTIRDSYRSKFPALFIAVPGDEEEIGGCLSAGRGFVHISAEGNVEPCPFAPYSDTNLRDSSLKDALQSEFLKAIRQNHEQLSETEGGCALWVKREWVRSLLHNKSSKEIHDEN